MAPAHPAGCSCGDEDSHTKLEGQLTFLYPFVDRDKVVALNAEEGKEAKIVIRPWDERNQEGKLQISLLLSDSRGFANRSASSYRGMARVGCRRATYPEDPFHWIRKAYVALLSLTRASLVSDSIRLCRIVRSILVKSGPSGYTPDKMKVVSHRSLRDGA